MNHNNRNFFGIIFGVVVITAFVTGIIYFVNANNDGYNLNDKAEEEIKYLSNEIINMMNELNNISFTNSVVKEKTDNSKKEDKSNENKSNDNNSQEKESNIKYSVEEKGFLNSDTSNIDWKYLKNNSEILYSIWTRSIIDLHSLSVDNQDIFDFSKTLDQLVISIKNEDKINSLINLSNLYSYIPIFIDKITDNRRRIDIENTKLSILKSYVFIEQNNWDSVGVELQNALVYYSNIINSVDEDSKESQNKVTKIYVLLNELNNSLLTQDKDIFYIKYKSTMQELMNL